MSTVGQVTHLTCPAEPYGSSHHLAPKAGVMTCVYCQQDEATIKAKHAEHRALIERMHAATTIDSAGGAS